MQHPRLSTDEAPTACQQGRKAGPGPALRDLWQAELQGILPKSANRYPPGHCLGLLEGSLLLLQALGPVFHRFPSQEKKNHCILWATGSAEGNPSELPWQKAHGLKQPLGKAQEEGAGEQGSTLANWEGSLENSARRMKGRSDVEGTGTIWSQRLCHLPGSLSV